MAYRLKIPFPSLRFRKSRRNFLGTAAAAPVAAAAMASGGMQEAAPPSPITSPADNIFSDMRRPPSLSSILRARGYKKVPWWVRRRWEAIERYQNYRDTISINVDALRSVSSSAKREIYIRRVIDYREKEALSENRQTMGRSFIEENGRKLAKILGFKSRDGAYDDDLIESYW